MLDKSNFDNRSIKKKKYYDSFKRIFDFVLSLILIMFFLVPISLISISILLSSPGPIIYWSDRIGKDNKIFSMPKFRTMFTYTPSVATHLLKNPEKYITPLGKILRKYSLDELPQFDTEYTNIRSLIIDFKIIYKTIKKVIISSDVKH